VLVDVALVVLAIFTALVVVDPLFVTDCNVLVFQIVTKPVLVLIEVSVPATILLTPFSEIDSMLITLSAIVAVKPLAKLTVVAAPNTDPRYWNVNELAVDTINPFV
jgi:hypothetical protein